MAKGTGKTARFYQNNPKSRKKHNDDNNSGKGGKYAHTDAYKKAHYEARKKLQIKPGSDVDAGRTKSGWKRQSAYENAADGGRKGAASNKRNNRKK